MRIDAHQHFWNLDRGGYDWLGSNLDAIYKNFMPSDLKPLLDTAGVDGTILIQADDNIEETQYLLELANNHSWILGVVGWVDLESRHAPEYIDEFSKNSKFVDVRPMLQDIDDVNWMLRPSLTHLSSEEVESLMGRNAIQFYLTRGRGGHQHVQSSFENNK